ncbi:MAG: hypothetical protein MJZ73_11490 [Bacteroidaceae bacterium]|nr:hypothetical protein [Bacteroidaceae bacterium]
MEPIVMGCKDTAVAQVLSPYVRFCPHLSSYGGLFMGILSKSNTLRDYRIFEEFAFYMKSHHYYTEVL